MSIKEKIVIKFVNRKPDLVIGGQVNPYLLRWFLLPRNPIFNVYLHQFLHSDDDRALHDHPWLFNISWLLQGEYVEVTIKSGGLVIRKKYQAGNIKFRYGKAPHRLELPADRQHCWTLFLTGPRIREWGFYCMEVGWVHWKRFTDAKDPGSTGAGCDA